MSWKPHQDFPCILCWPCSSVWGTGLSLTRSPTSLLGLQHPQSDPSQPGDSRNEGIPEPGLHPPAWYIPGALSILFPARTVPEQAGQ